MTSQLSMNELLTPLLAATGDGDRRAFKRLYDISSPYIFGSLLKLLAFRRDLAEDALQDCYLKIWSKASSFDLSRGAPITWMLTIARNVALDGMRERHCRIQTHELDQQAMALPDSTQDPLRIAEASEELFRLAKDLESLDPHVRESIELAFADGLTHTEIARKLRKPLGTTKSWIRRGTLQLRAQRGLRTALTG